MKKRKVKQIFQKLIMAVVVFSIICSGNLGAMRQKLGARASTVTTTGPLPAAGKVVILNDLAKPGGWLIVYHEQIYISDGYAVKIFSLKDFSLKKTIGRKGEGPGEFKHSPFFYIHHDGLWISSGDKISLFSHSGKLIKEIKEKSRGSNIMPIGQGECFIGFKTKLTHRVFFLTYVVFDSELKAIKEFHRAKWILQRDKNKLLEQFFYDVVDDKIVFAHYSTDFAIDILDKEGNKIHSIRRDDVKIPFTKEDRQAVLDSWRQQLGSGANFEYRKKRTEFPEYYPAICTCRTSGKKIYIITYLRKKDKTECLVYDMKGKFLKRLFIPLIKEGPIDLPTLSIYDGQLFQIIDNLEKETWDLHIHRIE
ncbi:MAG: hypothetical protein KAT34_16045 [Candidatus Aminicenantes bacterium]|nr:hypothetical protein [Candidatus Aminicenantes bacterium]